MIYEIPQIMSLYLRKKNIPNITQLYLQKLFKNCWYKANINEFTIVSLILGQLHAAYK